MREEQREGRRALALDELDRELVQDVGDVAPVLDVAAVVVERRVHELAVAVVADPGVVARPRHAVVAHVPLADVRGLVTQPLEVEVIVRQPMTHRVARDVVDDAVAARVLAGDDRRAVRRADRRGVERALEQRALGGEPVDVRRLHVRVAARAELVVAQVVDQNDQEIGLHRRVCRVTRAGGPRSKRPSLHRRPQPASGIFPRARCLSPATAPCRLATSRGRHAASAPEVDALPLILEWSVSKHDTLPQRRSEGTGCLTMSTKIST